METQNFKVTGYMHIPYSMGTTKDRDLKREDVEKSPQSYTREDLMLLWSMYKKTCSANTGNDPLYFLTDDPKHFKSGTESPKIAPSIEFDPTKYKQFLIDFTFGSKYSSLYRTSPGVLPYCQRAARLLYVEPLESIPLFINERFYWEIASWRLTIGK